MAASDRGGARGKAGRAAGEKSGLIRPRQWLALVGLAVAAFVFNTSEFVPIGLLTDIGASFSLAEEGAAVMISVYAWGVMLMSLPLMVLASRVGFRRLMLGLLAAGQFLCAVAPTFWLLVAARLVVAAAHSVFWAVVTVVAARVVDPRASSAAIGLVATGGSVAQIVGMPLGRAIGLALGWRMTFAAMGVASVATLAYLAVVFPSMGPGERFRLWQLPGLFRNRSLVVLYVVVVFLAAGQFAAYSYVEPFLLRVAGLPARGVTLALSAFGCAGLLGNVLFSRLYDGNRRVFLAASLLGESAALLLLLPAAASPASMVAALVGWGACQMGYCIAFQAVLIGLVRPEEATVAMAIYSGLYNLGIGGGTALGGVAAAQLGVASVGVVGGVLVAAGTAVALALLLPRMRCGRAGAGPR